MVLVSQLCLLARSQTLGYQCVITTYRESVCVCGKCDLSMPTCMSTLSGGKIYVTCQGCWNQTLKQYDFTTTSRVWSRKDIRDHCSFCSKLYMSWWTLDFTFPGSPDQVCDRKESSKVKFWICLSKENTGFLATIPLSRTATCSCSYNVIWEAQQWGNTVCI